MSTTKRAALIGAGAAIMVLALALLPPDPGRLEYAVAVIDPAAAPESRALEGLKALGAIRADVFDRPAGQQGPKRVILVPELTACVVSDDCALGTVPAGNGGAVAGARSGVRRGRVDVAGMSITVSGSLRHLGPLFDDALILRASEPASAALLAAGWPRQAWYIVPSRTWLARERTLARLKSDASLLPGPDMRIESPARRPSIPHGIVVAASVVLILAGTALIWRHADCVRELARTDSASSSRGARKG